MTKPRQRGSGPVRSHASRASMPARPPRNSPWCATAAWRCSTPAGKGRFCSQPPYPTAPYKEHSHAPRETTTAQIQIAPQSLRWRHTGHPDGLTWLNLCAPIALTPHSEGESPWAHARNPGVFPVKSRASRYLPMPWAGGSNPDPSHLVTTHNTHSQWPRSPTSRASFSNSTASS